MPRILIVEDDAAFARRMARNLEMDGFQIDLAPDGIDGLKLAAGCDAVLCDLRMPGMDGLEFVRRVRSGADIGIDPGLPIVILTSVNSVESAVEAMRVGASDYLTKEAGRAEIVLRMRRAMEQRALADENERLRERLAQTDEFQDLIGDSAALDRIRQDIREVAPTGATVLVTGETGSGKEVVARAIHHASGRKGEFVELNGALLPDDSMLQSELFGHERGAFTDARAMKRGKLEIADGGTLFLDEIGELSPTTQAKLLRVLETLTFTRLGGTRPIKVDVRIVAATNRDLMQEIRDGRFREDLYYRISVFPLHVPPLRDHPDDVLPLARHFLGKFAARYARTPPAMDNDAAAALRRYRFPGNVRELRNIAERIVIRSRGGRVTAELLRECGIAPEGANRSLVHLPAEGVNIDELERLYVLEALERCAWNQTDASKLLGISVDRMNNRVKKFGLVNDKWRVNRPGE